MGQWRKNKLIKLSPSGLHELSHHDGQDYLRQVVGEVDDGHVPTETYRLVVSASIVDLWVGVVLCDLEEYWNKIRTFFIIKHILAQTDRELYYLSLFLIS